jgi:hypothetical protein
MENRMYSHSQTDIAPAPHESPSRWAHWWIYALVIVPANLGKELLLSDGAAWWLRVAITAVIVAAGIAVVTAIHRVARDVPAP